MKGDPDAMPPDEGAPVESVTPEGAASGGAAERRAEKRGRAGRALSTGFRSSRRSTRTGKANRRSVARLRLWVGAMGLGKRVFVLTAGVLVGLLLAAVLLLLAANGINAATRWYVRRNVAATVASTAAAQAGENLLIVALKDGKAAGFLATRVAARSNRIYGIAIPDGAFVEVPGQGFEAIGSSFATGAAISKSTVSNYLSVPFDRYVAVSDEAYQYALKNQTLAGVTDHLVATDMSANGIRVLAAQLSAVPTKNVALVPLPVKPITIGDQRYLEPQRAEVADLLSSWWGVKTGAEQRVRVIVQNGIGTPGIAGSAAKQLIGAGFQVVNTENAGHFGYSKTLVLLYKGPRSSADKVCVVLKAGTVQTAVSGQDIADIIVVIGKDYVPPPGG